VPVLARVRAGTRVALRPAVLHGLTLALLLSGASDAEVLDARGDARKELDDCATRIEQLKAQRRAGELARRELERLLVRAQELAQELERTRHQLPLAPPAPSPEELRERADAARDEADRLAAEIAALDVQLGDARRIARAESDGVARAVLGAPPSSAQAMVRFRELAARRAALAERRALAEAAAARYEAEARVADADH
jgi:hypothetical protein